MYISGTKERWVYVERVGAGVRKLHHFEYHLFESLVISELHPSKGMWDNSISGPNPEGIHCTTKLQCLETEGHHFALP